MTSTDRHFDKECDKGGWLITNEIRVTGTGRSFSGQLYIQLTQQNRSAWINRNDFTLHQGNGLRAINKAGLTIILREDLTKLLKTVDNTNQFSPMNFAERVGWGHKCFGYPDGRVFSGNDETVPVTYQTGTVCVRSRGTVKEWRNEVGRFLLGQHLPLFCIMAAFSAPVLRLVQIQGNFGFMLSGPARKGKTTCIDAAGSTCGPVIDGVEDGRYYLKFSNTMNRIEEWLPQYNDLPFIVDELSSHGTKSSRLTDFRTLVHYFAGVDSKGRYGNVLAPALQSRVVAQVTSNDRLDDLLALESPDAVEAVADRLIEISVSGEFGAFRLAGTGYSDIREYAEAVRDRVGRYYGTAMPAFLQTLTERRAINETKLRNNFRRRMHKFADNAQVRALGSVSSRIVDAFALAYASGEFAKFAGVLPKEIDCLETVLHCFRLHVGAKTDSDPVARLLAWLADQKPYDLRRGVLAELSDTAFCRDGIFLGKCKGETQLWVSQGAFARTFGDARSILRALKRRGLLKLEGKGKASHWTVKCAVRSGRGMERVHVLTLPNLDELGDKNLREARRKRRRS